MPCMQVELQMPPKLRELPKQLLLAVRQLEGLTRKEKTIVRGQLRLLHETIATAQLHFMEFEDVYNLILSDKQVAVTVLKKWAAHGVPTGSGAGASAITAGEI